MDPNDMLGPKEDNASCPAGCWEGDASNIFPDADDCYRCPVCGSPLEFELDGDDLCWAWPNNCDEPTIVEGEK